jgi:hypothetical protein
MGADVLRRAIAFLTLSSNDRIVAVKSWWPTMGRHGIEWPTLLVDTPSYRCTATPVWDAARLRNIVQRLRQRKRVD